MLSLPCPPWLSFAYGSAIFKQETYTEQQRADALIDLMLVVEDPVKFHRTMMKDYPQHYSSLAHSFPWAILPLQRSGGAIWFNTEVSLPPFERCKYGVISRADALNDLWQWRSLYLAGRLHKPVKLLGGECPAEWEAAVAFNRRAALAAALLLFSSGGEGGRLPMDQLLQEIVSLSYRGDVRMSMGEAPGKVTNIVQGQRAALLEIYREPLQELSSLGILSNGKLAVEWDPFARRPLMGLLPPRLRHLPSTMALKAELERTVRRASLLQTAKGLLTVPPVKAFAYAMAKIKKRFPFLPK